MSGRIRPIIDQLFAHYFNKTTLAYETNGSLDINERRLSDFHFKPDCPGLFAYA